MRTFSVDTDNNITVFASEEQTKVSDATGAETFASQPELTKLAAAWPGGRLVEIWNSLTGVEPVKKFTDRKTAIARIWKAIQSLQPATVAAHKAAVPSRNVGTRRAAKSKAATKAKAQKKVATEGHGAREGSKTAAILALVRRAKGATLEELMAAAGWQAHSMRGFLSAVVTKKMGLKLQSSKRDDGKRVYKIAP